MTIRPIDSKPIQQMSPISLTVSTYSGVFVPPALVSSFLLVSLDSFLGSSFLDFSLFYPFYLFYDLIFQF